MHRMVSHIIKEESSGSKTFPRCCLPCGDDDAFFLDFHQFSSTQPTSSSRSTRGTKRSRLSSDDDVFFRPRARLAGDSTPQFPRARLPSDSDSSSMFYPRHRRFRGRENRPLLQPLQDSSSIQLSSSQYTADDTADPAFKTPSSRSLKRRSSEMSSLHPNSSREYSGQELPRTPFAWISPNLSDVSHTVPMSDESITDVRLRLFHQVSARSSVSDTCFSPVGYVDQRSTPSAAPTTSSPREADATPNLAHSILAEEMRSDSGISSLPSFGGQACFSDYRKDFGEKLVDVMVKILNKVDPPFSPVPDHYQPVCYRVRDSVPVNPPVPAFPDTEISPLKNGFSSDSSFPPCFDSPPDVYPGPTPASSPLYTTSAGIPISMLPPRLLTPPVFPSAPTPASSPLDATTSDSSLTHCFGLSSEIFLYPAPTPVSSPQDVSAQVDLSSLLSAHLSSSSSSDAAPVETSNIQRVFRTVSSKTKTAECKVCHKILSNRINLKIHMRIHTGERPYACPFCPKAFSDRTAFRRHKRLHTGKPFVCELCRNAFVTKSQLRHHETTRHR